MGSVRNLVGLLQKLCLISFHLRQIEELSTLQLTVLELSLHGKIARSCTQILVFCTYPFGHEELAICEDIDQVRGVMEKYPPYQSIFSKLSYGETQMLDKAFYEEEVK